MPTVCNVSGADLSEQSVTTAMLHSKRHKSSHSPSLCAGRRVSREELSSDRRVSPEELSSDRVGSDESSSAQEMMAEPPADSFIVIDNAPDETSEVCMC